MDELGDHAKSQILRAMYQSVERMNRHIVEGSLNSASSEQRLQINLRQNFKELGKKER